VEKAVAGICGVTDLMAEEGHAWPPSGRGCYKLKVHPGEEDVKRRKDEIIEWRGVIVWGRIPRMELPEREVGGAK